MHFRSLALQRTNSKGDCRLPRLVLQRLCGVGVELHTWAGSWMSPSDAESRRCTTTSAYLRRWLVKSDEL